MKMNVVNPNSDHFARCEMFCCEDHLNSEADSVRKDCGLNKDDMDVTPTSTLFCICCLEKGTLYINLLNCSHTEFLNNLKMPEVKLEEQIICYQCHNMLKKIKLFKLQVEESFKLLCDKVSNISKTSIKLRNFEARLLHNVNYPSTTSEKKPQKSKNEMPQAREHKIPQTKENEIPKTKENVISQTKENLISQTKENEVPQTRENGISQTRENYISQTRANDISQTRANEIPQSKENEIIQTRKCEMPQTKENDIPQTRENEISQIRANEIPQTKENEMPQKRENEDPETMEHEIPQAKRRKTMTGIEGLITEGNPETNNTENPPTTLEQAKINPEISFLPSRSQNINKNIEDALKIINTNQNSGCIDLLASSLKTISYSFLQNILCNSNLPTVLQTTSNTNPASMLFGINTPTTAPTASSSKNITINNTKENNNTNLEIGRQSVNPTNNLSNNSTPTTNNVTAISGENITSNNTTRDNNTNLELGRQSVNPTNNLPYTPTTNNATAISSEIITINNTTEYNNTNVETGRQISTNHTDNLLNINAPTTSATSIFRENVTVNNTTRKNKTELEKRRQRRKNPTDKLFNINSRTPSIINATFSEYLDEEKDDSIDGGQPTLKKLSSNIKQITISRDELMKERSKLASSKAYRSYQLRCESCLMGFEFKENLDDHVRRKHSSERLKDPVQCDVCLQFMDDSCLKKHSFWHFTRYECPVCSQKFTSFDDAAQHYKKHPRVDKRKAPIYKCPVCHYKTPKLGWMEGHVRRVTKCKTCDEDITHGCGTGVNFYRHEATCKGANP